ncbi:hypothetical protein [Tardiphaga sp. 11_C7_N12_6]|uniref:hypothetical protein n=1 Tax=Tardiphaga sp. 11_C7_N12_6 TaxID=3240789 RepID=UPI003F28449C
MSDLKAIERLQIRVDELLVMRLAGTHSDERLGGIAKAMRVMLRERLIVIDDSVTFTIISEDGAASN